MPQLTTFVMVLVALFIWWSAIFHADAQGYYVDQYSQQQQLNAIQQQNQFNQRQQELSNRAQQQIQQSTGPNGNYCYNCNGN